MKRMVAREDGWCDWQFPTMQGYRMACCDCGLVHNMEFEVHKVTKQIDENTFEAKPVEGYRVRFKARRNNRSTAAMRRKPKEYSQCSGDPSSCPENEGYGCCKPNPNDTKQKVKA